MTEQISPKDLIAQYRRDFRDRATTQNTALDRSAFPGLLLEPTGMIYPRGRALLYHPVTGLATPLTAELLHDIMISAESSTVIYDRETFGRIVAAMNLLPSQSNLSLPRRLRLIAGLPASVKMPILTDALAVRYWLPDYMDESNIDDWAQVLGAQTGSPSVTMRVLIRHAREGVMPKELGIDKQVTNVNKAETSLLEGATFTGLAASCSIFSALEPLVDQIGLVRLMDPSLLELHILDGQVARLRPMNIASLQFTATVSDPFKLKEGARLFLTDGQVRAKSTMMGLRFTRAALHATFSMPSKQMDLIRDAHSGVSALYAVPEPWSGFSRRPKNNRWINTDNVTTIKRDVPLDVVLAGAPVE